jgi:hypothetical protein
MDPTVTTAPARLSSYDAEIVAPWFALSGCDADSPQWATAWVALASAGLATRHSLRLFANEEDLATNVRAEDTTAAHTVRLALVAGARYAVAHQLPSGESTAPVAALGTADNADTTDTADTAVLWNAAYPADDAAPAGDSQVDAGIGVAVVLALFHACPAVLAGALALGPEHRAGRVLTELDARVAGIYDHAAGALAVQVSAARTAQTTAAPKSRRLGSAWPPLVELVLREAIRDEVFAEHIIMRMAGTDFGIGYVVLPDGRWLILHTG